MGPTAAIYERPVDGGPTPSQRPQSDALGQIGSMSHHADSVEISILETSPAELPAPARHRPQERPRCCAPGWPQAHQPPFESPPSPAARPRCGSSPLVAVVGHAWTVAPRHAPHPDSHRSARTTPVHSNVKSRPQRDAAVARPPSGVQSDSLENTSVDTVRAELGYTVHPDERDSS